MNFLSRWAHTFENFLIPSRKSEIAEILGRFPTIDCFAHEQNRLRGLSGEELPYFGHSSKVATRDKFHLGNDFLAFDHAKLSRMELYWMFPPKYLQCQALRIAVYYELPTVLLLEWTAKPVPVWISELVAAGGAVHKFCDEAADKTRFLFKQQPARANAQFCLAFTKTALNLRSRKRKLK